MYLCIYFGCAWSLLLCVGFLQLQSAAFSLWGLLLSWSTGSGCADSVAVAHRLSCFAACGIFPDQGSNQVPYTGRWILIHGTTREDRLKSLNKQMQYLKTDWILAWNKQTNNKKKAKKWDFFGDNWGRASQTAQQQRICLRCMRQLGRSEYGRDIGELLLFS